MHPQNNETLNYIGVSLTLGRLSGDQMRGLASVARQYGNGDIRLTVWQNVIIPHVHCEDVEPSIAAIRELGLDVSASSFSAGVVACTGRFGCQFASTHTKEHGHAAVRYLQERFQLDQPINIHLTGCVNSCAQHYIGDIGLLGSSTEDGREAYQVFLGGGCDHDQGFAQHLWGPVPADELNEFLASLVATYLAQRESDESFLAFVRHHDETALKEIFLSPDGTQPVNGSNSGTKADTSPAPHFDASKADPPSSNGLSNGLQLSELKSVNSL